MQKSYQKKKPTMHIQSVVLGFNQFNIVINEETTQL